MSAVARPVAAAPVHVRLPADERNGSGIDTELGHQRLGLANGQHRERRIEAQIHGNGSERGRKHSIQTQAQERLIEMRDNARRQSTVEDGDGSASESPEPDTGSKRRDTSTGTSKENGKSGGEGKDEEKKAKKRRKVNHACVYCRRSHMTCDQGRPCSRCIKRDIGHLCHDEPREQKKMKGEPDSVEADGPRSPMQKDGTDGLPLKSTPVHHANVSAQQQLAPPTTTAPMNLIGHNDSHTAGPNFENSNAPMYNDWNNPNQFQFQDIHNFHPNYMFNTSEVSNEYSLLNDFLSNSLLDDAALYQGEDPQTLFADPSLSNIMGPMSATNTLINHTGNQLAPSQAGDGNTITRPQSRLVNRMDQAQEKYYMTAADPAGTEPPEERMNKLLKAKYDAGLLKPFSYVKGYARLNQYMEKHLRPISKQKILRQLEAFRPKFRERMQSLTDVELIRVEMWFEMKLMEYDRVFASMAIPACCWRRTGEIFRGNREMAELIGVPLEQLREGKLSIHDIVGEDSLVMYWTKFGQIAFDASKKAMLAGCTLKRPDRDVKDADMRCCFSFTVQRDEHLIPSIIIGNFLPISSVGT